MPLLKTTYNRRSFLKVGAATSGGMILGFSWLASCTPTPEEVVAMPDNWMDINAFLKIGDNGLVTIMSPNPEIGQGVKTSMPMIVAEELDCDWKNVVVKQAGLDTDKFVRQLAGGSQSIRQGWESLRMAGATARHMLREAAARSWDVPLDEVTTREGIIHHKPSGQLMHYGQAAAAAVDMPIPEEVELKDPKDFSLIGTRVKNVDGPDIVTGKPLFGLDLQKENAKVAMLVHAPGFGLKLKGYDDSTARRMPGISSIFRVDIPLDEVETTFSDGPANREFVAIVGDTTWQVLQAKKALAVDWEADSEAESTQQHIAKLDALLAAGSDNPARRDGDPQAAFAQADRIVERAYSAPFLAHNTMEPMNFYAHVTDDGAALEGPIQTPENLRATTAQLLGMDTEQVSVMMTRMGGGFGRRLYGNFGLEAALISRQIGAPVKLVYTREDDMTQGTYRPMYKAIYRAGLDEKGNIIAFHVRGVGADGSPVFPDRFPAGAVPNYLAERIRQETNISIGAWRAPRSNFIAFAEQSFLDEIAEITGKDPIDLRLELFDRAMRDPTGEENDYDAERYAGVLRLVREKSDWDTKRPGVHRGVSAYYCHNSYVAQVVDVVVKDRKHHIQKIWCAVDCGIVVNPEGAINQIEGGMIDGIGHAMYSAMTFSGGRPDQSNFDKYRLIRNSEAPDAIEVFFVDNGINPTGLGEPSLPPVAAALANALYKATGKRLYDQPFAQSDILG